MPLVAPVAHCIAPDLIGFGQSGKPNIEYRFADQVRYLDAFLVRAGISSAFVIAHDGGSALAFHLAARRPDFIRGLAFMEFLWPMPTWEDFNADGRETFQKFRTPGLGERTIHEDNVFIEQVLPGNIIRKLTDEEMAIYRAPFPTPASRVPTWRFPNELPITGNSADVYSTIEQAHVALLRSSYPKLLWLRARSYLSIQRGFCPFKVGSHPAQEPLRPMGQPGPHRQHKLAGGKFQAG
jgi:haloalkane dehalogenase